MITLADLGLRIVSSRKEKQLTQSELAERAGVSRPTIDLIENGRASEIGYSKLVRILAAVSKFTWDTSSSVRPSTIS